MQALKLRGDYDAVTLGRLATRCDDGNQVRRLLAIAAAYEGHGRAEAGAMGGMDRLTLRDWVLRFTAEGPDGLIDRTAPGNPRRLTSDQEAELARLVEGGPASAGLEHLSRWRCLDLKALIEDRWGATYHERTIGKLLDRLGYSHITTRPKHYRQDEPAMEAFKKTSRTRSRRSGPGSRPARR
jgi:transposase